MSAPRRSSTTLTFESNKLLPTISVSPPSPSLTSPSTADGSPHPPPIDICDAPELRRGRRGGEQLSKDDDGDTAVDADDDDDDDDESLTLDGLDDFADHDEDDNPAKMATWAGQPSVKGNTEAVRMVLLTFVTIGITFTWGIEMTYCTPYLLNLGLTKSNTSLVWIAGPLSGLLVQPIIGVVADESKSRWGRRRPFMVAGSLVVAMSLIVLGFTKEIVGLVISDGEAGRTPTIVLAVLSIYVVDFAINAVMSCARSLVVDTLPVEKQQSGSAWAGRMAALGHLVGYGAGAIDLVQTFGTTLGETQFQQLAVISSFAILASTAITCWAVTERVLVASKPSKHQGTFKVFRQIYSTLLHLPPRIQAICWAQFWSWIGWFPFLFYSTTWIGETYFRYDVPASAKASEDTLGEMGRIGSTSLVIYSTITFIGAWLLPMVVQSPEDSSYTHRPPQAIAGFLERFNKVKPDLLTTWIGCELVFSVSMAMAPFATSFRFATALVCFCGIPWSVAHWAPTTFLGIEVNKLSSGSSQRGAYRRVPGIADDIELPDLSSDHSPLRLEHGPDPAAPNGSTGELSGIYFGILNIYTTLPQFVGTFIATIVFAILEPGKSPELGGDEAANTPRQGPNAIAVCLFIGAMSSIVAMFATRKLRVL